MCHGVNVRQGAMPCNRSVRQGHGRRVINDIQGQHQRFNSYKPIPCLNSNLLRCQGAEPPFDAKEFPGGQLQNKNGRIMSMDLVYAGSLH